MFWNWNLRNVDDPTSASPTCVSLLLGGTSQAKLPLASIGRAGWAPGTWNPSTGCLAQARRSGVAGVVESLINFHFLDRISERMARNCATAFELATQITTSLLCGKAAPPPPKKKKKKTSNKLSKVELRIRPQEDAGVSIILYSATFLESPT